MTNKFKEWDRENEEKSKIRAKQYSIPGVWFTHPEIWDNKEEIFLVTVIVGIVIWILLP